MKPYLLTAILTASTMLTACSGEENAFAGKSPEELATYLVFGLRDNFEHVKDTESIKTQVITEQPFTITMDVARGEDKIEFMRVVATKMGGCTFEFDVNRGANHPARAEFKISADLSNLSAILQRTDTEAQLTGASITCLEPAEKPWCIEMKGVTPEKLNRFAMLEDKSVAGHSPDDQKKRLEPEQKLAESALAYFRKEVCP